jgi:hypothetical protein
MMIQRRIQLIEKLHKYLNFFFLEIPWRKKNNS